MKNLYNKFTFKDGQGRTRVIELHRSDVKEFRIALQEAMFTENITDVYMYDEDEGDWRLLDYYND